MRRALVLALLISLSVAPSVFAQGVRGDVRFIGSFLQYRSLVRHSIPDSETPGEGTDQVLPDGTPVTCVPGLDCYWYEAGSVSWGTPFTQELRLTAWPGYRGLSFRAALRSRLGSDSFWPRSSQEVEAVDLHLDFQRPEYRIRAGRIQRGGGLGLYFFDGGTVQWRPGQIFRIEAYGGRSRARVINQPRTGDLLAEVEERPPGSSSLLLGAETWIRLGREFSASAIYQRERRTDGHGLYSERAGLDLSWRPGSLTVEGSTALDLAFMHMNDGRVRVSGPLGRGVRATGAMRYYRPFLELWTIWGAFSPIGYAEGLASLSWQAASSWTLEAGGAYRAYEETNAGATFLPIDEEGWRAFGEARYARGPWSGFMRAARVTGGADRVSVDVGGHKQFRGGRMLGAFAVASERSIEYRFGKGTTLGLGVEGRIPLGSLDLDGGVGVYRHGFQDRPGFDDYTQWRIRLAGTWRFGMEPRATQSPTGRPVQ